VVYVQALFEGMSLKAEPCELVAAASEFYGKGRKDRLIEVAESVLNLVGGRLYEGYTRMG
jgi:hypothetical protein